MKTRNEKIAKIMNWTISDYIDGYDIDDIGKNDAAGLWLSKLMQRRMVDDGWWIQINFYDVKSNIGADAIRGEYCFRATADTEPAAIVELFCKVYGI